MSTVNDRSDGRLPTGRFDVGNRAALGNPNNRRMQELRKALLDSATPERIKAVGETLCKLAEGGDVSAAKLYLEMIVGKPSQAIEISGMDGEPLGVTISQLRTVIFEAVGDIPEAQVRVAHALRSLTRQDAADAQRESD